MIIKSIQIPDYNGGDVIEFQDTQQDLIEFYLATHSSVKRIYNKNISINCILGDNGCGKSRLFGEIKSTFNDIPSADVKGYYEYSDNREMNDNKNPHLTFEEIDIKKPSRKTLMIDDFFIGSNNLQYSVNRGVIYQMVSNNSINFLCLHIWEFFRKAEILQGFAIFLNSKEGSIPKLQIQKNIEWYRAYGGNHIDWLGLSKITNDVGINKEIFDTTKNHKCISTFLNLFQSFVDALKPLDPIDKLNTKFPNLVGLFRNENRNDVFSFEMYYVDLFFALGEQIYYRYYDAYQYLGGSGLEDRQKELKMYLTLARTILSIDDDQFEVKMLHYIGSHLETVNFEDAIDDKLHIFKLMIQYKFITQGDTVDKIRSFYYKLRNTAHARPEKIMTISDLNSKLSSEERDILELPLFKVDIRFDEKKGFANLSGGEKSILTRFVNIYTHLLECANQNKPTECIILIDEPDLHLHLDWQRQYIAKLIDTFSTVPENIKMHFIIATHSPFIISDLPKENIIRMRKEDGRTIFTPYGEGQNKDKNTNTNSFGANYVDLIQNGFFNDQILMGNFAESVINGLAIAEKKKILGNSFKFNKDQKLIKQYLRSKTNTDKIEKMKKQIGDDFLRSHLLYF